MTIRVRTLALLVGLLAAGARGRDFEEYQVKAVFLFNFAKFVDWPGQSFKTPGDPIMICIWGEDPFGGALEARTNGKEVAGRSIAIRQVSEIGPACQCQILFVSSSERQHFRSILRGLQPAGILTVGEVQGFAAEGGVINFKVEGERVRFEINLEAAERQQLRISSKLLSLAQIVKTAKR